MKLIVVLATFFLLISCQTFQQLKPNEYVYKIHDGKACFYSTMRDLEKNKNIICKELIDLEGWLIIESENLKKFLTQGVESLIALKNQEKPKQ